VFEGLFDASMKGLLVIGIGCALLIRFAFKHPNASDGIARGLFSLFFRK
jgi:hypothetical protein